MSDAFQVAIEDGVSATSQQILAKLDAIVTRMDKIGKSSQKSAQQTKKSSLDIIASLSQVGLFAEKIGSKIFDLSISVGKFVGSTLDLKTTARANFMGLTGSVEETNKALKLSADLSTKYGASFEDSTRWISRFSGAGGSFGVARDLFGLLEDISKSGLAEKAKGIEDLLVKVQGKGFADAGNVSAIAEMGGDVERFFNYLDKRTGKKRSFELFKDGKLPKLKTDDFINSLANTLADAAGSTAKYGEKAEKLVRGTWGGAWERLGTTIQNVFWNADQSQGPFSKALEIINGQIDRLNTPEFQKTLGSAFEKISESVGKLVEQLPDFVTKFESIDWGKVAGGISTVASGFGDILGIAEKLAVVLPAVQGAIWGSAFGPVGTVIGGAAGAALGYSAINPATGPEIKTGLNGKLPSLISGAQSDGSRIGAALMAGEVDGIVNGIPTVLRVMEESQNKIQEAAKKANDSHSPSLVYKGMGQDIMSGLANGIFANMKDPIKQIGIMNDKMQDKTRSDWDIHSPSKVATRFGEDIVDGFLNPLQDAEINMPMNTMFTGIRENFGAMAQEAIDGIRNINTTSHNNNSGPSTITGDTNDINIIWAPITIGSGKTPGQAKWDKMDMTQRGQAISALMYTQIKQMGVRNIVESLKQSPAVLQGIVNAALSGGEQPDVEE